MKNENENFALLLGTSSFSRGLMIETTLNSHGYGYIRKNLKSSTKNWMSIIKLLSNDDEGVKLVLLKLTENILFRFCLPEFSQIGKDLLALIKNTNHQIFVYEPNLFGSLSCINSPEDRYMYSGSIYDNSKSIIDNWCMYHSYPDTPDQACEQMNDIINNLIETGFNVVPYRTLVDIDTTGQSFIQHTIDGLVFHLYVINNRLWSKELDHMIILFRDYISQMLGSSVQLSQSRTDSGIRYSLYSKSKDIKPEQIKNCFGDFAMFLDMCDKDPNQARIFLKHYNLSTNELDRIISRYSKEAKRIFLDLQHEKEIRLLSIKHALENDLQELQLDSSIMKTVSNMIPDATKLPSNLEPDKDTYHSKDKYQPIFIINQQIIHKVEGIVAQHIEGTVSYSANDNELTKLFKKYTETQSELSDLRSALDELRDKELPKDQRTSAWQKISRFLAKNSGTIGEVGLSLLKKYIEGLLNGNM